MSIELGLVDNFVLVYLAPKRYAYPKKAELFSVSKVHAPLPKKPSNFDCEREREVLVNGCSEVRRDCNAEC